ncbi:deaminated glutathione amidase [Monosporozyma unispora]|nr:Carbon-nitrogen hydrolase [Kazachstania unispora]
MSCKIAIGQLCSSSSLQTNLRTVVNLISKAMDNNVKLIFFPEATDYMARNAMHSKYLVKQSPLFVSNLQNEIRSLVLQKGKPIDVSIGVHLPVKNSNTTLTDDRTRNVLLYINHRGEIINQYQKLHLFDVDVANGPILKESESVQPGNSLPTIFDTPVGKLGSAICYDIRFPELSLKLRSMGSELICFPSAFTMKTGEAHWELLARTRAIDTQCYVIMPGQDGIHDTTDPTWDNLNNNHDSIIHNAPRQSWGHSMIVDPWGNIIAKSDSNFKVPQLIFADIDLLKLNDIRERMPLWQQRRNDIFH